MVHVVGKWYIKSDGKQYILFQKRKVTSTVTGEKVERILNTTYHSSVSSCLDRIIRFEHMKKISKATDSGEVLSLFDALEEFKRIENIVLTSAAGKKI